MKVVILCGGRGIRLAQQSDYIPKAMVKLGHRPIVWHVMKRYSLFGFNEFILALGYKGEMIRDFFANYDLYTGDVRIELSKGDDFEQLSRHGESEWKITLVDTGEAALTGSRIARCKKYLDKESDFMMVTYADCLADVNLEKLLKFHKKNKKIATISGVVPPFRIGELLVKKNLAIGFYNAANVKSHLIERYINGGFMVFKSQVFSYLSPFNECMLETEVFENLIKDSQLAIYPHHGFWRWLDTDRDYLFLADLVDKNKSHWLQE